MKFSKKFIASIGTLWFLGHSKIAPGTIGAFCGTIFSRCIFKYVTGAFLYVLVAALVVSAIYVCQIAERSIGAKDPPCIIFDEFIAMPICFLFISNEYLTNWMFILGFLLFRMFDITKPFGIKRLEKTDGGLGIILDDVAAACCVNAILHGASSFVKF